ncbi:50S ribosomal protein L18e [Halobacteriales archaeon QS_4_69_34]|nr:MAG: 50S ribosomal protein L18e [Halobacteriales archaeon QS_4_69_34]
MNKTNPRLDGLIAELRSVASESEAGVWAAVAERLAKPRRTHAEVNLGRIERHATAEELVVVPGKVLGAGVLDTPVTVAAVDFSDSARTKIERVGEPITLERALETNPEGADARVVR